MKMVVAALIAATVGLVSCIKLADGAGENSENGSSNGGNGLRRAALRGQLMDLSGQHQIVEQRQAVRKESTTPLMSS